MTGPAQVVLTDTLPDRTQNEVIDLLKEMLNEYSEKPMASEKCNAAFIDDMLYSLGVAINAHEYKMAGGYTRFLRRLQKHIHEQIMMRDTMWTGP